MKTVSIEELRMLLQRKKVHFEYDKKDGTICEAYGTLKSSLIPKELQPKNESQVFSNFRYFDLDKNGWRSVANDTTEVKVL
jgi:hypothetical protein